MKIKLYILFLAMLGFFAKAAPDTITNSGLLTTNLIFTLNQDSGLHCFTNLYHSGEMIDYTLLTIDQKGRVFNREVTGTPEVFFRRLPENESFEFHLFDSNGREVQKTKRGIELSARVKVPESVKDVTRLEGRYAPVGAFHVFRPEDTFVLTNKGMYELEICLRVWAQVSERCVTNHEIIGHFDKRIGTNACFSVVTSTPARVKILKQ